MINRFFKRSFLFFALLMVCGVAGLKAQTLDDAVRAMNNERYDRADSILQILEKKAPSSKIHFLMGENAMLNYFADTISNSLTAVAA